MGKGEKVLQNEAEKFIERECRDEEREKMAMENGRKKGRRMREREKAENERRGERRKPWQQKRR